jgi:hypothetical protein
MVKMVLTEPVVPGAWSTLLGLWPSCHIMKEFNESRLKLTFVSIYENNFSNSNFYLNTDLAAA